MERALRYFVLALFFLFPVAFAGIPAFWWSEIPRGFSLYEGVKIAGFFLLTFAIWFFVAVFHRPAPFLWERRNVLAVFATVSAVTLFSLLHGFHPVDDLILGRTYSVSVFAGLAAFVWGVSLLSEPFKKDAVRVLVLGFVVSNFPYAFFQVAGFDPVFRHLILPEWGDARAFGTFGNPNSLALFSVICLPFAFSAFDRFRFRMLLAAMLLAVVFLTKSLFASAVATAYVAYKTLSRSKTILVFVFLAAPLAFSYFTVPEKTFSLQLRAAIALDVAEASISSWRTFLFGEGGGAVERLFSLRRSGEVAKFVNAAIPISHSHSLFLEIALVFWVPFSVVSAVFVFRRAFQKIERPRVEALSIFLLLSAIYLPSVAHLALLGMLIVPPVPKKRPVSEGTA